MYIVHAQSSKSALFVRRLLRRVPICADLCVSEVCQDLVYVRYLRICGAREGGVEDCVEIKAETCRDAAGWKAITWKG